MQFVVMQVSDSHFFATSSIFRVSAASTIFDYGCCCASSNYGYVCVSSHMPCQSRVKPENTQARDRWILDKRKSYKNIFPPTLTSIYIVNLNSPWQNSICEIIHSIYYCKGRSPFIFVRFSFRITKTVRRGLLVFVLRKLRRGLRS